MSDERERKENDREEEPDEEAPGEKRVRTAAEIAAERAARLAEQGADEATPEEEPPEELPPPLSVSDLLRYFCGVLLEQAWQKLGLRVDLATGEATEDLGEARLAIDALAALVEKLDGLWMEQEREFLKGELANLRLNYVQRSSSKQKEEGT